MNQVLEAKISLLKTELDLQEPGIDTLKTMVIEEN